MIGVQGSLGEEGMSLEFRHIGSYLLWYCQHHAEDDLLHELVLCIGYFCVLNHDNQVILFPCKNFIYHCNFMNTCLTKNMLTLASCNFGKHIVILIWQTTSAQF